MNEAPRSSDQRSARVSRVFLALVAIGVVIAGTFIWLRWDREPEREKTAESPPAVVTVNAGRELYLNHCAACHGETGDGLGPAAVYLYPRPRNFRAARYRLVTTANLKPSDEDLFRVITRGMPGSAMFSFAHLSEGDRHELAGYVRALTRAGMLEQLQAAYGTDGDQSDIADEATRAVQPGPAIQVPELPANDLASVARGKRLYQAEGCHICHGETGKGDGAEDQRDDLGMPIRPRDLTRGVFKGGHEPRDLYARLTLGLPGTPMPAFTTYTPTQIGDLIHFTLSLSSPETRRRAEHQRLALVAERVSSLPAANDESAWSGARRIAPIVSPLWWRDHADPYLQVAAKHDGKTLMLQLAWSDGSRNDVAYRPEDFEDMAAVQFFRGAPEPFFGMGAAGHPVDLWAWRAVSERRLIAADSHLDDYPFDTTLYRRLLGERPLPDLLAARAAGNLVVPGKAAPTGSNISAAGIGSTTFRPKSSQVVSAHATWKDGKWTLVFTRPLAVDAAAGVSFASGDKCAIGFALWDGEAKDRASQKLISAWHDLTIE